MQSTVLRISSRIIGISCAEEKLVTATYCNFLWFQAVSLCRKVITGSARIHLLEFAVLKSTHAPIKSAWHIIIKITKISMVTLGKKHCLEMLGNGPATLIQIMNISAVAANWYLKCLLSKQLKCPTRIFYQIIYCNVQYSNFLWFSGDRHSLNYYYCPNYILVNEQLLFGKLNIMLKKKKQPFWTKIIKKIDIGGHFSFLFSDWCSMEH